MRKSIKDTPVAHKVAKLVKFYNLRHTHKTDTFVYQFLRKFNDETANPSELRTLDMLYKRINKPKKKVRGIARNL